MEVLEGRDTSVKRVEACLEEGYDVYFNLCDGAADEDTPGIEVVQALERHRVPFTGATSTFYEPSREAMKAAESLEAGFSDVEVIWRKEQANVCVAAAWRSGIRGLSLLEAAPPADLPRRPAPRSPRPD